MCDKHRELESYGPDNQSRYTSGNGRNHPAKLLAWACLWIEKPALETELACSLEWLFSDEL
jgi:hypothetical protein